MGDAFKTPTHLFITMFSLFSCQRRPYSLSTNPLFFISSTNRSSTKSSALALADLASVSDWTSKVFLSTSKVGSVSSTRSDVFAPYAASMISWLSPRVYFCAVGFVIVNRLRHGPYYAPDFVGILANSFSGGDAAVELKRDVQLRHIDDHLESHLFTLKLFTVRHHGKIGLTARHGGQPGRRPAYRDCLDIFVRYADFHQRQSHSEIRRRAGDMYCRRPPPQDRKSV